MNTYDILCDSDRPLIHAIDNDLWNLYIHGEVATMQHYRNSLGRDDDAYWSYNFILICLIHLSEGGSF